MNVAPGIESGAARLGKMPMPRTTGATNDAVTPIIEPKALEPLREQQLGSDLQTPFFRRRGEDVCGAILGTGNCALYP